MSSKSDRKNCSPQGPAAVSLVAALIGAVSTEAFASQSTNERIRSETDLATRITKIIEWVRVVDPKLIRDLPPDVTTTQWRN
jgi:hypothetical protein